MDSLSFKLPSFHWTWKLYWRKRISTVDLLVLISLVHFLLIQKILLTFLQNKLYLWAGPLYLAFHLSKYSMVFLFNWHSWGDIHNNNIMTNFMVRVSSLTFANLKKTISLWQYTLLCRLGGRGGAGGGVKPPHFETQ